jgi:hypothetical protein
MDLQFHWQTEPPFSTSDAPIFFSCFLYTTPRRTQKAFEIEIQKVYVSIRTVDAGGYSVITTEVIDRDFRGSECISIFNVWESCPITAG